jgi:hypothetical protein
MLLTLKSTFWPSLRASFPMNGDGGPQPEARLGGSRASDRRAFLPPTGAKIFTSHHFAPAIYIYVMLYIRKILRSVTRSSKRAMDSNTLPAPLLMYSDFPPPVRPGVITERRRVVRLLLGNISAMPAKSRVVFECTPQDRIVTVSEIETAAETHDR